MKLKSKLIATIVSMCAAIAVMGVGVWASTSQNFTVTIKNDIDVKILNVNADVYGEFAVYSQFSGSAGTADTTPAFATRITGTQESVGNGTTAYNARTNYDHGYLLYAIGIGGYNDGRTGAFDNKSNYVANKDGTWGYGKYINEAKNNAFLATKNGTLANSNTGDDPANLNIRSTNAEAPFESSFNVDSTTHVAQVAYLYTINQWAADGASNAIYGTVNAALSEGAIEKIGATTKSGETTYNSLIIPNVYGGVLSGSTTSWKAMNLDASTGDSKFLIPRGDNGGVYYVLLTFTFARNNANLDLQELQDALSHSLTLVTEDAVKGTEDDYETVSEGSEFVNYATSASLSNTNEYTVTGSAYNPSTTDIKKQVTGAYNQEVLKNWFALSTATTSTTHLPTGFIYLGTAGDNTDMATTTFGWVADLYEGKKSSYTPWTAEATPAQDVPAA